MSRASSAAATAAPAASPAIASALDERSWRCNAVWPAYAPVAAVHMPAGRWGSDLVPGRRGSLMLEVTDATLHYGAAQALRGVSLKAGAGKITCVLGRNGVGKTSLMRSIVGHHRLTSGSVAFEGKALDRSAAYDRARSGIAFVPQGREIFPLLTVRENLESGFAPLKRAERTHSRRMCSSCFPVLKQMLGAARRRSVRRPAAAARHRPRAGDAAEAAGARRADRRHPAVDHQGYRPRHPLSCATRPASPCCWSSNISISAASSPTR